MLTLRRALKRKKLFEELDEKWKTAELVLLGQEAFINRWTFKPNYYLVVECAEVDYEGEVFHLIITLDPTQPTKNNPVSGNYIVAIVNLEDTMSGHDEHISEEAYEAGFTCWNLKLSFFNDIQGVKNYIMGISFLYKEV